jgi:hypothetical protein
MVSERFVGAPEREPVHCQSKSLYTFVSSLGLTFFCLISPYKEAYGDGKQGRSVGCIQAVSP